jgi:hypothetical protein
MKSQENSNPRISREDGFRGNLDMRGQRSRMAAHHPLAAIPVGMTFGAGYAGSALAASISQVFLAV